MTKRFATLAAMLAFAATAPVAQATVLFQNDPSPAGIADFSDSSAGQSTVVGTLTVSQAQTIQQIGVLNNLDQGANIKFFIADATTGTLLYVSDPTYFAAETGGDLNLTYKVSPTLSFTFLPGVNYAVGSIADTSAFTDLVFGQNSANGFSSDGSNNVSVSGYNNIAINTSGGAAGGGFELLDLPEPMSMALLATGLVGTAALRRFRRGVRAKA